jgi:hypothetical protein
VFPVRYKQDLYILFGRNSFFKGLIYECENGLPQNNFVNIPELHHQVVSSDKRICSHITMMMLLRIYKR